MLPYISNTDDRRGRYCGGSAYLYIASAVRSDFSQRASACDSRNRRYKICVRKASMRTLLNKSSSKCAVMTRYDWWSWSALSLFKLPESEDVDVQINAATFWPRDRNGRGMRGRRGKCVLMEIEYLQRGDFATVHTHTRSGSLPRRFPIEDL